MRSRPSAVVAWTLAWWLTGAAMYVSGVFNSPRTGPLWVALAGGAIPWAIAGNYTFRSASQSSSRGRRAAVLATWALAYLASFGAAAFAATALDMVIGGFLYMVIGWSLGGSAGAFVSTWLTAKNPRFKRAIILAAIWMLGFFVGGFVALFGLYVGPELGKITIGSLIGMSAALTLGAGFGCGLGGLAASAVAVGLTRLVKE